MCYILCSFDRAQLKKSFAAKILKIGPGVQKLWLFKVGNFGRFSCDGKNVNFGPFLGQNNENILKDTFKFSVLP